MEKAIPAIECPANVALMIDNFATIQKLKLTPNNKMPSTFTEVAVSMLSGACKVPQPVRIDVVVNSPPRIQNVRGGAECWNNFTSTSENKQNLPTFLVDEWLKDGASYSDIIKETSLFVCHCKECHW